MENSVRKRASFKGESYFLFAWALHRRSKQSPWAELDHEEEALSKSPYGGLGFDEKGEHIGWHGGKILFHGKLQDASAKGCKKQPKYKITLDRAELSTSNMFGRRFGSKHFFRLKLTKAVLNRNPDPLMNYLRRPLILCGNVFRAFYAKDTNVFYVKTNERTDGSTISHEETIDGVMSFLEFLDWHNPMALNAEQVCHSFIRTKDLTSNPFRQWLNMYPGLLSASPTLFQDCSWSNQISNSLTILVCFGLRIMTTFN